MSAVADAARVLYEPPRAPRRRSVGRPAAVLGAVLLVCVVAAWALRLGQGPPAAPATRPAAPNFSAATPEPQTADGAQHAALRILALYAGPKMYDARQRPALLDPVVDPAATGLTRQLDAAFALAAQHLGLDDTGSTPSGTLVARALPAGVHLVSFGPDRAVVSVWSSGLLGIAGSTSRLPVQESWSTETVTLHWTSGGWRWADLQHADGPAPIGSAQVPAGAAALAATAAQYAEVTGAR